MEHTPLQFEIEHFRTTTGLNAREKWFVRSRRVKAERSRVATALWLQGGTRGVMPGDPSAFRARVGAPPFVVTLTRISSVLADDDGVVGGLKSVRDEIANWLGTGDSPRSPVSWRYAQERGRRKYFGVRIRIESENDHAEA